jgi:hypothetical protein
MEKQVTHQIAIEKGVGLLKLCQQLQSEKDGVDRPEPGIIDKTKTLDDFAKNIKEAITYLTSLYTLLPMQSGLADLGRELEKQGKIKPDYGDSYAQAALAFLLAEHGLTPPRNVSTQS